MDEHENSFLSSTNDGNNHSIKKQKTRKVLTATVWKYDQWIMEVKIDQEDCENIQEIVQMRKSDGTPIEDAVTDVAVINRMDGLYRVKKLKLYDEVEEDDTGWYDQPHLPISVCNLDAVREMVIKGTQIETFFSEDDDPDYSKVIPNLQKIHLESMPRLRCLPSNLGSFSKLQNLELTKLPIDALPDSLSSLAESLRTLKITRCRNLTGLPEGFGQLHSLQHLETFGTPIQHLPDNFGNLERLQRLEMEFQHLKQLPSGFSSLTNVWTLTTGRGAFHFPVPHPPNLSHLATSVYNIHQFAQRSTVRDLDLDCPCDNNNNNTEASVTDAELHHLSTWSNLVSLNFNFFGSDTYEYTLPKGLFSSFSELKRLRVGCTAEQKLAIYVDEIPCLKKLEDINLISCILKSAQSLEDPEPLQNLNEIALHDIKGGLELLSEIRAPFLKTLYFEDCVGMDDSMFSHLCISWFPHLKNLRSLKITRCSIANIQPEHLHCLGKTDLVSIGLRDNPIFRGSKNDLERKLLPLVQHCQFLCDFGGEDVPTNVAYHLCLNSFRRRVTGEQRICPKGLWAFIFEKPVVKATRGFNKEHLCQADVIYAMMKELAVTELYG
ncbi:small GTP-binding domain protein [Nitzschia inconspicua]|uniref:Small GTP-binding domain protein n=1 Tax=Nitzschia inconspicua TaxID=303405 RepID=A0A9K3KU52_9STRA|nr:small GTP-binding domain protein [Nitzschia inconspicua]